MFFILLMIMPSQHAKAQVHVNSISSVPSTCPNNGTITVNAASSSPPVLYSIVSGPVIQQSQTSPVFNSLPAGNYTVKITDGTGDEVFETVTIGGNYLNPAFTAVTTSPYCQGESNGELVLNMTNGTGLAPFSWELLSPSPVTGIQSSSVFENLPAGNYSVRVTDACGSISTNAVTIIPPNTAMSFYGGLSAQKIGCDSMLIRYKLDINEQRFPFSFSYQTTNGTYIPTGGTTIDISSNYITITQVIPDMTYGHSVSATVTNACGDQITSPLLTTYPFVFYPKYSFNECGNSVNAFYENPPGPYDSYHTALKNPVTYTYTDLSTNTVVASGTEPSASSSPTFSVVGVGITGGVAIPGRTYRLVLTDGCGESFTQDYTIPVQAPPVVNGAIISNACIDSVAGTYRLSTSGFGTGRRMVILSGPSTLGSTKPEYEYSDTYTWPSDTVFSENNPNFFISNLAPGTYHYKIFDDCGREIISSFTITPQQVTSLSRNVWVEKGCPGENKMFFSMIAGGTVTVKKLSDNSVIKTRTFTNSGGIYNQDSVLHVSSGQYEITYDYEHNVQTILNDNHIPCWRIVDTITVPPYYNPEIAVGNAIMCNEQIQIELVPDTTRGVPPFQYEISSGPQIFPLQSSNMFTVNIPGTYYARIFDACGNATVKQVTIDTLSFDPIEVNATCVNTSLIFPSSIYYTYEWLKPNGQIHIGDSLILNPVTPADTGVYEIYKIVNVNGCVDTFTTTYHIDLPNYVEQTIPFCEGTTVAVGGSIYDSPGVYTDTLISSLGCDSLVVTTLTLLLQLLDTTVVSICSGDSILISGNYHSVPGFYTDSVQSSSGCYDLLVTELKVEGSFYSQFLTLCSNESYSVGNNTYSTTGIYYDTLQSVSGCDSIIVLNLEILPDITYTIHETICQGDSYVFSGNVLSATGLYTDTLLSVSSCDSIVTLNLFVQPLKLNVVTASICEGEFFYFGGDNLTTGGIYVDTVQTNSCDSIVTLHLTVLQNQYHYIYDTICEGTDYVFGGLHYTHPGIYTQNFPTSSCDSIVALYLTVTSAPTVFITSTVLENGEGLAVVQLNAVSGSDPLTYLWDSSSSLSNHAIKNPTIAVQNPTWVTLTVTDQYGCTSTLDYYIQLPVTSTLYLPNAITPDGGELNNVFRAYGTNIASFHILIFDRWGEAIFESYDVNFVWDATYKGKLVQDGVYTYKLSAVGTDGVYYDKAGHVTVIK